MLEMSMNGSSNEIVFLRFLYFFFIGASQSFFASC